MQRNGIHLPNTIWQQILGYSGWEDSFEELSNTIGDSGLLPSTDQEEWWFTGGIRTKFLDKSGKYGKTTIVYNGQTPKGKRLSNKRDRDQRDAFRRFTYYRALTTQDPFAMIVYGACDFSPVVEEWIASILNTEEINRFKTQTRYTLVDNRRVEIQLVIYDNREYRDATVLNKPNVLLDHRGAANYHLQYTAVNIDNPTPLAWNFVKGFYNSFVGIEPSNIIKAGEHWRYYI